MFIVRHYLIYEDSIKLISLTEYAAVGYIAKRIEMRKKRYQNLQKLAEQRRAAMAANNSGPDGETSTVAKSHVQYLVMSTTAQSPRYHPFLYCFLGGFVHLQSRESEEC